MPELAEQPVVDFYRYPSVDDEDWRYAFATAKVRAEPMLSRAVLEDMANAETLEAAVDFLASTEYALPQAKRTAADIEDTLLNRRNELRRLFADLMSDEPIVELFKARDDFANMRLAIRRMLKEKPLGTDYSSDGNIKPEQFEEVFEHENYGLFPEYMQDAVERAILAYYQDKDIREIDYAIDTVQAEYNLKKAVELKNDFLIELFRMQTDLTNIRTMLRIKFTGSQLRGVFLTGGYVSKERLKHGLDVGYEALGQLFFATPYYEVVESAVVYLNTNKSFLLLEQKCQAHINGFLKTTNQITAGPGPVIAYLLLKEEEIRTVRLILTGRANSLDPKLILDRIGRNV